MKRANYSIAPLGDSAIVIDFGNRIDLGLHQKVMALSRALESVAIVGVLDIVPAYSSITLHYDVCKIPRPKTAMSAYSVMKDTLRELLSTSVETVFSPSRKLRIPVCYTVKYGLDLKDVALFAEITVEEVIQIHTSRIYTV